MLLRKYARPTFTKDAVTAFDAVKIVHIFIGLFVPLFAAIWWAPSCAASSKTLIWNLMPMTAVIGLASWLAPNYVLRELVRFVLCKLTTIDGCIFEEVLDTTGDVDYYQAQFMWGDAMKYHKVLFM